jgi:hypothetical protein
MAGLVGVPYSFSLFFTVLGGAIGYTVGVFAPGFYEVALPRVTNLRPVEYGIGAGLTQGFLAGAVTGVLVVAISAILGSGYGAYRIMFAE